MIPTIQQHFAKASGQTCEAINDAMKNEQFMLDLKKTYDIQDDDVRVFLWAIMLDTNVDAKFSLLPLHESQQFPKGLHSLCVFANCFVCGCMQGSGFLEFQYFKNAFHEWVSTHWLKRSTLVKFTHLYYDQRRRFFLLPLDLERLQERVTAVTGVPLQHKGDNVWRDVEYAYATLLTTVNNKEFPYIGKEDINQEELNAVVSQFAHREDPAETNASGRYVKSYVNFIIKHKLLPESVTKMWLSDHLGEAGDVVSLSEFLDGLHQKVLLQLVEDDEDDHLLMSQTWLLEIPTIRALRKLYRREVKIMSSSGVSDAAVCAHNKWSATPPEIAVQICKIHSYLWNDYYYVLLQGI
jgi:hypothetical protein